ncbi:hypothetical protein MFLAVUS_005814 [Mucor flavus]|uniref:Mitochondrial group I intron splicing factor CCM1 n=1 Tax=Mucor flavus TaxID=439312 RepID=A0ABP9YZS6_9FUNG
MFKLLKRSQTVCQQQKQLLRSLNTRGLQEDRTKKVIEEIKKLEYEMESKIKTKNASFERVDEQDIAAIYKEISAPIPIRPKISPDYLENLRLKFLDTRSTEQLQTPVTVSQLTSGEPVTQINDQPIVAAPTMQDLTLTDFEQLIYANALAKRPKEAEQAFELMEKYNVTPSIRSVNHLMDAYANTNNIEQTISTFKRLDELNLKPDIYSYGSLIKAFVASKRLEDAFIIFEKMKKTAMIPSQPIFANLISGCLKADKVDKAWEIFDSMRLSFHQPDEVSFTLMLHACAKRGEVEKALNLFEDMAKYQLYPTDVTFNVLINACAKRPDYYVEAFSLLDQMQENYGFQPDKITFNTLLTACARKKDLGQARDILRTMWVDFEKNGSQSLLAPDNQTFTNLFWCYASYIPKGNVQDKSTPSNSSDISTEVQLLPLEIPNKRNKAVKEAQWLFNQLPKFEVKMTPALLTAYLALHISQKQTGACIDIYHKKFDQFGVQKDAFTFYHMLQYCYHNKDGKMAWKVWEDYQDFLEARRSEEINAGTIIEKKAKEAEQHMLAIKEGWTNAQQQKMAALMANTLARTDDLKNAMSVLSSELRRSSTMHPPRLRDMMPFYNKCIQLEDLDTKRELVYVCVKDPVRLANSKYQRVNRID